MYTNYGKSCRGSKKSSSEVSKESEKVKDVSAEDAVGEDGVDLGKANAEGLSEDQVDLGKANAEGLGENEVNLDKANAEGYVSEEGKGAESSSSNDIEKESEKETSDETEDYTEGGEGAENADGTEGAEGVEGNEDGENQEELGSEDEGGNEDLEDEERVKKPKKSKGPLEYDIKHMYPEMNVLIQKKKKEWDYQDPDIIRALWLESKTNVLAEWKIRNAKINTGKPSIEVRENVTVTLRQEHLKNKAELQKALEERDFEMTETTREPPNFESIQLATNLTTEMRYKYNRNNPPVPSNYVEHFEKYKKPPFKNIPNTISCKL